jgi:hypothetical protein
MGPAGWSWRSGEAFRARPERSISVAPVQGGWRVTAGACEPLMFLSGGCAERQARALAQRLARLGYEARVEIHDRGDLLAGSFSYRPLAPPGGGLRRAGPP